MNGYDKYLEFQFRQSGNFYGNYFYEHLFNAICVAGGDNLAKLALGFPEEVEAYKTFTRVGVEAFLEKCSPDHPLITRMREWE